MRDMAEAISESARIPLSLSGPLILGVTSGAIGKGLKLESGADRIIRANLYMLGLGKSGTGKSSAFKLGAEPITAAEIGMLKFWREISRPEIKAELRILEREIKALEGKKMADVDRSKLKKELAEKIAKVACWQEELQEPRMIVEDVTQEALGVLLARNSEQLFSLSADAGKTLQNLEGRYMKEKGKSDDEIYIKAYTGDRCVVDRIGRDPVILENPCLSLFWLMQPERAQRLSSATATKKKNWSGWREISFEDRHQARRTGRKRRTSKLGFSGSANQVIEEGFVGYVGFVSGVCIFVNLGSIRFSQKYMYGFQNQHNLQNLPKKL